MNTPAGGPNRASAPGDPGQPDPLGVDLASVDLPRAYRCCRDIAAAHGRTYHLATRLLSAQQRPAVHALYAFARVVDDIVDVDTCRVDTCRVGPDGGDGGPAPVVSAVDLLDLVEAQVRAALGGRVHAPASARALPQAWPAVLAALTDTVRRFDIDPAHFWTFLDSMRMDVPGSPLFRDRYADMAELTEYMRGSAAAIGLQLVPVLGTVGPRAEAEPAAAALGEAFQLTNFLRDVAEDLDRGRIYLPAEELAAFGVDEDLLAHCRASGETDPRVRRALAHLIELDRAYYRRAEAGIDLLAPRVRPAIRTASVLYAGILERIEESGYAVFRRRAVVPRRRKLAVAAGQVVRAALPGRVSG